MKLCLVAFTFATLFLGLIFVCLPVQGTDAGGIISSDTTWTTTGSPYTLTKNTLVGNGVTLRIEAGVTVNIKDGCYLQVNGTLIAKGTEGSKINFNGGQIRFTAATSSYNEQTGTGSILENCVFTSGIERQVSIKNCSPKIANNIFHSQLYLAQSTSTVSSNIFDVQVHVSGGSNLFLKNTFKQGLSFDTVYGDGKFDAKVLENVVSGAGIYVAVNSFNDPYYLTIEKNLITNNYYGILVSSMLSPTIRYNTIVNNTVGIELLDYDRQSYVIKYNTIINQQNLVLTQWVGCPDIDATNNWWGTTDKATISASIYDYKNNFDLGTVNFTPFLTEPNPNAPDAELPPTPTFNPTPTASTPTSMPPTTPSATIDANNFNIESNSTISAFSFDGSLPQVSFIVSGPNGTSGYVKITIAKTFMPTTDNMQVYLDGHLISHSLDSNVHSWIVTFTYQHSSHQVTINSTVNETEDLGFPSWIWDAATIAVAVSLVTAVVIIFWLAKKKA